MDGDRVNGIFIEASLLFSPPPDVDQLQSSASLRPAAHSLLRTLRYSKIRTAIFYEPGLAALEVILLEEMAQSKLFDSLITRLSSIEDDMDEVALAWGVSRSSCLLVLSGQKENLSLKLKDSGWLTVILNVGCAPARENSSVFLIRKLEELPLIICHLNKKANSKNEISVVGYVMKPSREEDFAKRGALPLSPTPNGLVFFPLNYELPMPSQLQQVDAVLHKVTDEIITVEMSGASELDNKIVYTKGMQELQRCMESQTDCCIIDPFRNIYPVLDRLKIQQILVNLENICSKDNNKIRGPRFLKVDSFEEPNLAEELSEVKLKFPNIVKPQVACGVADAHSMAIVFKVDEYKGLNVPLPAVLQEYVDHSSCLFKFYVLGKKVFYAVKKSTPNTATLMSLSEGLKPILFDSLKSLPIAKENQQSRNMVERSAGDQKIDLELVTHAANQLREILDLTIFGFDVVIQEVTGDHVIVDVNYLPSFKEVPDDVAIPAFWEAIKGRLEFERNKRGALVS